MKVVFKIRVKTNHTEMEIIIDLDILERRDDLHTGYPQACAIENNIVNRLNITHKQPNQETEFA